MRHEKAWHRRVKENIRGCDQRASARYARDLKLNALLAEMADLLAAGQLSDERWIEFQNRGSAILAGSTVPPASVQEASGCDPLAKLATAAREAIQ